MKPYNIILLFIGILIFNSCDDFIEKDISKKTVTILAPAEGYKTSSLTNTYWWEEVDGAEEYRFQIVKGTFSNIVQYVVDSTFSNNKFDYTLSLPGNYQWRVRAMNNGSFTEYSTHSLIVDSTNDLSGQTLALIIPAGNSVFQNSQITFQWTSIFTADFYRLQILDSIGSQLKDTVVISSNITMTLTEGEYTWRVRAENNTSVTPYSYRTFAIDQTGPNAPICISPINKDTVIVPFDLNWFHDDFLSGDSLYVYSDSLQTLVSIKIFTSNTSYLIDSIALGKYYWRVKSFDLVGNESPFSTTFSFLVQ